MSGNTTYRKIKLRLIPTKEQEELMWKHVHASRFIYNWGLERWYSNLDNGIKNTTSNKLSKELKTVKQENPWLKEVSNKTLVKSLQVLEFNMKRFFKKQIKRPKFKSSKSSIPSFKTRRDTLKKEVINYLAYGTTIEDSISKTQIIFMEAHLCNSRSLMNKNQTGYI